MEIQEIIRRWQAGEGYRQIASGAGLSRNTVRKYLTAVKAGGITREGGFPGEDQLIRLLAIGQPGPRQAETPSEDLLAPWADQIYPVGQRGPAAADPYSRATVGPRLPGIVPVAPPLHSETQLE